MRYLITAIFLLSGIVLASSKNNCNNLFTHLRDFNQAGVPRSPSSLPQFFSEALSLVDDLPRFNYLPTDKQFKLKQLISSIESSTILTDEQKRDLILTFFNKIEDAKLKKIGSPGGLCY